MWRIRVVLALVTSLISPRLGRLRLIYIDDGRADYAIGCCAHIVVVAVFGAAIRRNRPAAGFDPGAHRSWCGSSAGRPPCCWRFS